MAENINPSPEMPPQTAEERIDEVRSLAEENLRYTKAIYGAGAKELGKDDVDVKQLLQENLSATHEIYRLVKKIKRQLFWQKIWGAIKILLIVVPLALAAYYLYPLYGKIVQTYSQLMNLSQGNVNINIDAKNISPDAVKNLLNQIKK